MRRPLSLLCMISGLLGLFSCSQDESERLDDLSEELFTNPPEKMRPGGS